LRGGGRRRSPTIALTLHSISWRVMRRFIWPFEAMPVRRISVDGRVMVNDPTSQFGGR
jgi:hypothetical protein